MISNLIISCFIFLFGLCIGSFLNVCIHRIPESKSIVRPPSSCPHCGVPIKIRDNIPVFGYILLRGRCRNCSHRISPRYPMVELLTGLCALAVFLTFGASLTAVIYFAFIATLLVITFIDIDHGIIPDLISLPGMAVFFLGSLAVDSVTLLESLAGIALGAGSLFTVAYIYFKVTGQEGMGRGDVKLLAMIGALIGWKGVLLTIFLSSALGSLVGMAVMIAKGGNLKLSVPFGPFLAAGAICHVFFGPQLINWYLGI